MDAGKNKTASLINYDSLKRIYATRHTQPPSTLKAYVSLNLDKHDLHNLLYNAEVGILSWLKDDMQIDFLTSSGGGINTSKSSYTLICKWFESEMSPKEVRFLLDFLDILGYPRHIGRFRMMLKEAYKVSSPNKYLSTCFDHILTHLPDFNKIEINVIMHDIYVNFINFTSEDAVKLDNFFDLANIRERNVSIPLPSTWNYCRLQLAQIFLKHCVRFLNSPVIFLVIQRRYEEALLFLRNGYKFNSDTMKLGLILGGIPESGVERTSVAYFRLFRRTFGVEYGTIPNGSSGFSICVINSSQCTLKAQERIENKHICNDCIPIIKAKHNMFKQLQLNTDWCELYIHLLCAYLCEV